MPFQQLAVHVIPTWVGGEVGIYARRFKKQKSLWTTSESIDSSSRTILRRNDMLTDACFNRCSKPPMSFQQRKCDGGNL